MFIPKIIKCSDQARYEKLYSDLASCWRETTVRGHWGKNRRSLFQFQRRLETYGNNMKAFGRIVERFDPKGIFANQFGVVLV